MAVSGGSDSLALLHLLADRGPERLLALTVDHRLRPEAAEEAVTVGRIAAGLGVAHRVLRWEGWDGSGNTQDQARRARYRLLAEACAEAGIADVALGHTRDDNVETFFLGLTRGAGLDGLSGMRHRFTRDGVTFHRPLLDTGRAALRDELVRRGVTWADDPSNDDPGYERVRIRQALAGLDLDPATVARSIGNLHATRRDLGIELLERLCGAYWLDHGDLVIDRDRFEALSPEFRRRTLAAALRYISGSDYPPRGADLMRLVTRDWRQGAATLHGCILFPGPDGLRISREYSAVRDLTCASTEIWDNRWRFTGSHRPGRILRALGPDGLAQVRDRTPSSQPHHAVLASPSAWHGERLVAAPMVSGRLDEPENLQLTPREDIFRFEAAILSH
ncbi:tRNA lysidine(34) synthetase TilS [Frigidibacter sp. ROC022]|uniref:tRNA lysidine(34) synthetase TilS n=1 Tax=Frigidibacter sp. ROC022 TaxID=2971796 RepID=UPI00215A85F1|nr:tRNA lysidine(34) synthetase TilS [Frigidibacter sp. ROC022]